VVENTSLTQEVIMEDKDKDFLEYTSERIAESLAHTAFLKAGVDGLDHTDINEHTIAGLSVLLEDLFQKIYEIRGNFETIQKDIVNKTQ